MAAKSGLGFAEAHLAEHIDLGAAAADKDLVPPALGADLGLKPVDALTGVLGHPHKVLGNQQGWAMGPQFDKTALAHLFDLWAAGKACFVAAAARADIAVAVAEASVVEMEKRTVAAAEEAVVVAEASVAAAVEAVVVVEGNVAAAKVAAAAAKVAAAAKLAAAVGDAVAAVAAAVVLAVGDVVETAVVAAFAIVIVNMAAVGAAMEHSVAVVAVGFPSLAAEAVASNSAICNEISKTYDK